jgi:hypothetical protein
MILSGVSSRTSGYQVFAQPHHAQDDQQYRPGSVEAGASGVIDHE